MASAAAVLLPVNTALAGQKAQAVTVYGAHDGDAIVTLATSGKWTLRMIRPTRGLVVVGLVPLNGDDYSLSAIAFPNTEVDTVWFASHSSGFSGSWTGGKPRWVEAAPINVAAGRYRLTLITKRPSKVQLIPPGGRADMQSTPASLRTRAGFGMRTLRDPSRTDLAHETVDFSVPVRAHQVVLVAKTLWSGNQTIDYDTLCYTAGVAHQAPCLGDPEWAVTHAVNPGAPDDRWTQTEVLVEPAESTGPGTANFYFAVNGDVSRRTLIAIALP